MGTNENNGTGGIDAREVMESFLIVRVRRQRQVDRHDCRASIRGAGLLRAGVALTRASVHCPIHFELLRIPTPGYSIKPAF